MAELVPVRVRDCACPDKPHAEEGDIVFLRPTLSFAGGLAAEHDNSVALGEVIASAGPKPPGGWSEADQARMAEDVSERLRRRWLTTYVRHGAAGWNLINADGEPVPFDAEAILDDYTMAQPVAEKGDELYGETVTRPLLARLVTRSPRGPKAGTTSPTNSRTPARSRRSSRATSAATKRSRA